MMTKIWIVQGVHPTVSGKVLIACATPFMADNEAADLVKMLPEGKHANPSNWPQVLNRIRKEQHPNECDVWVTETEVVGA